MVVQRAWTIGALIAGSILVAACGSGSIPEQPDLGECFDDPAGVENEDGEGEVGSIGAVDCADPHDNEVFLLFDLPDGDFPGEEEILLAVEEQCVPAFETFVGIDFFDSELDIFQIAPTSQTWDAGDREVLCAVTPIDDTKVEGTLEGSAR